MTAGTVGHRSTRSEWRCSQFGARWHHA